MSQDFTDDCYAGGHQATTDLENFEKNFAALKSCFSGASAPNNPVAGMWWLDTTNHLLKIRNEANDAWFSVWDMANNKPVISNLSNEITGAMISSTVKDAAASTASLRTLGTTSTSACAGNDYRLSNARACNGSGTSAACSGNAATATNADKVDGFHFRQVSIHDNEWMTSFQVYTASGWHTIGSWVGET